MPDWLLPSLGYVGALVAVYTAIRVDLARLHEKAEGAKQSADNAHKRIDGMLEIGMRR